MLLLPQPNRGAGALMTAPERFAQTIEHFEALLAATKERNGDSWRVDDRQWIANQMIMAHHWQALEEYLAREAA